MKEIEYYERKLKEQKGKIKELRRCVTKIMFYKRLFSKKTNIVNYKSFYSIFYAMSLTLAASSFLTFFLALYFRRQVLPVFTFNYCIFTVVYFSFIFYKLFWFIFSEVKLKKLNKEKDRIAGEAKLLSLQIETTMLSSSFLGVYRKKYIVEEVAVEVEKIAEKVLKREGLM